MTSILRNYLLQYGQIEAEQLEDILKAVKVIEIPKGRILIDQDSIPQNCYFILQGLLRKHQIRESGQDVTIEFYNEGQSVNIFYGKEKNQKSPYTVSAVEDCVLIEGVVGDDSITSQHPLLNHMMQEMVMDITDEINESLALLVRMTPEEKVNYIMDMRPYLLTRVPQHQLASYLGMTPESLSRIKKRLM